MIERWLKRQWLATLRGIPCVIRSTWVALGQGAAEVSTSDYHRLQVRLVPLSTDEDVLTNADALDWPVAKEKWGKLNATFVFDSPLEGQRLLVGSLDPVFDIVPNSQLSIPAGALRFRLKEVVAA